MEAAIGIYDSHNKAIAAIRTLKETGFAATQISLISRADLVDKHIEIKAREPLELGEASIGITAGVALGVLTGVGVFAIPGLGFLYGAGALVGALGGLDIGIIAGGLTAVLTSLGISAAKSSEYEHHLKKGNLILFVEGNQQEIEKAKSVLHNEGFSLEVGTN